MMRKKGYLSDADDENSAWYNRPNKRMYRISIINSALHVVNLLQRKCTCKGAGMRRSVVMTVLCLLGIAAAWQYELTLAILIAYRSWVMAGMVVVGCTIAGMWLCPRNTTTTDMTWYLALFPGMGIFGSGMGYTSDEEPESTGGSV